MTTLPPSCAECLEIWSLNRPEPSGPHRPVIGVALPLIDIRMWETSSSTQNISLCSINRLKLALGDMCLLWAGNFIVGHLFHEICGRAIAQEVSSGTVASVVASRSQTVSPCGTCRGPSTTDTGFSPSTAVSPCQYHSTNALYSSTCCSYQEDEGAKSRIT